jgi:hypothetical protein
LASPAAGAQEAFICDKPSTEVHVFNYGHLAQRTQLKEANSDARISCDPDRLMILLRRAAIGMAAKDPTDSRIAAMASSKITAELNR